MSELTVQDGKLVVRDGKIGTGQACCCGGGHCCINGRANASFTTQAACEAVGGRWVVSPAATCTGTCGPGSRCGDGCECVGLYGPMPGDPYMNGNCEQCCGPYTCNQSYFSCNDPQFSAVLGNSQPGDPDPCETVYGAGWYYAGFCACIGPPYEVQCCSDCRFLQGYEQYGSGLTCDPNPFP